MSRRRGQQVNTTRKRGYILCGLAIRRPLATVKKGVLVAFWWARGMAEAGSGRLKCE